MVLLPPGDHHVRRRIVFLSPHLDDAALSCGGLICSQALSGTSVLVVSIFAGSPALSSLSPLAAELHGRWGNTTNPVGARRQEDRKAMRLLGADCLHLGHLDAIYRAEGESFLYVIDEELFASPRPSEAGLLAEIVSELRSLYVGEYATLFAPLAVGNHVDHQLVRHAALALEIPSRSVVFYEDYPYVERPGDLTKALDTVSPATWKADVQSLSEECLQTKIKAIAAYRSQLGTLFSGEERMALRVRDYSLTISPDHQYGERYWRITGDQGSGHLARPVEAM
jgi:LmbE family N-acetylglucosaminyl deacetylase